MNSSKLYEHEIKQLRKEITELDAYKRSIDLYITSNLTTNERQLKTLPGYSDTNMATQKSTTNYQNNQMVEPPPSFLKAAMLGSYENLLDSPMESEAGLRVHT